MSSNSKIPAKQKIDYDDPYGPFGHASLLKDAEIMDDTTLAVKYRCSVDLVRLAKKRPLGYKPPPRGRPARKSGDE